MKKLAQILFSPKTTVVLLGLFTVSIAVATFIEDSYDTNSAQLIIYQSWWFELMLLLMALNFVGNLSRYHFFSKGKLGGLIFHVAFILLIAGAAITRYFGYEGTMYIREGEKTDLIYSNEPFIQLTVTENNFTSSDDAVFRYSALGAGKFRLSAKTNSGDPVTVSYSNYIKNAEEFVLQNTPGGADMIALQISTPENVQGVYLKGSEHVTMGGVSFSFADSSQGADILMLPVAGKIVAKAADTIYRINMTTATVDSTLFGSQLEMAPKSLYRYHNVFFTFIDFYRNAELDFRPAQEDGHDHGIDVLTVDVEYKKEHRKVHLTALTDPDNPGQKLNFGNINLNLKCSPKSTRLPFSLALNDFSLERYPGSMSPSSFASDVTVIDKVDNISFGHRIYMNHVLDYGGYRFFQSSYDTDEKGTILSVNHDFWGTWVSYLSYFLLLIGFIITMFTANSRYHFLIHSIRKITDKRKSLFMIPLLVLMGSYANAQHQENHVIGRNEAEKLGKLLVQTYDGRLEPIHTLAYDVMHKISRKHEFKFDDKGQMDAMQALIDMMADPEYWKNQKVIYIREESVRDILGIEGKYASFNDFITDKNQYKLSDKIEMAFQKPQSQQNRFDKEVIKVDERVNLFYSLLQGSILKIFPSGNSSGKWVDWTDSLAQVKVRGTLNLYNEDFRLETFNYNNAFRLYLQRLMSGTHSGNYEDADKVLRFFKDMQVNSVGKANTPSDDRIDMEIAYNKAAIFTDLTFVYLILGFLMLVFAFAETIFPQWRPRKWFSWSWKIFVVILLAAFLYHTYGMILRWYLSDHAPWSNGYEALLLVSWSTVLAGFLFVRNTSLVQAATALLAGIILMTAGHSNYDPQLTNLQPVLKSYWLIIHVAVITISYGFLSLGFILGIFNMVLYLIRNSKNGKRVELIISELTFINEINMQIGLFLATLGTFLGAVWASESWGRYWGWDAKETWALVIIIVYSIVLHLRLIPSLRGRYIMNVGSIFGFASVLMTFIGVNYYLSKGLHSYASDDKSVFPIWGWIVIVGILLLIISAGSKARSYHRKK